MINFNQQFRLKTNVSNSYFYHFYTCDGDLPFYKIGTQIGAFTTILLIFLTAILGVYYAKYEGLNTLRADFYSYKNETPTYEVVSGAAIAFAALLLIIPGFATDIMGFLLIFPFSRKFFFNKLIKKNFKQKKK